MNATVLFRQVAAELIKARRRSLYFGALAVLLFFALLPLIIGFSVSRQAAHTVHAEYWSTFPNCILVPFRYAQALIPLLVAIVAAGAVGGDYAAGTWKMILPRTATRSSALLARLLAAIVLSLASLWFTSGFAVASGFLGSRLAGIPFPTNSDQAYAVSFTRIQLFLVLEVTLFATLAAFTTVVSRSVVGGALLGMLGQLVLRLMTFLPGGWVSPAVNLDLLESAWVPLGRFKPGEAESAAGRLLGLPGSTLLVVLFSIAFTLAAVRIFEQRDMAGD